MQPSSNAVVVYYDGSGNDIYQVWYRGAGNRVKYEYTSLGAEDLKNPPDWSYFLPAADIVPAGIGTSGGRAVPIYFRVSK